MKCDVCDATFEAESFEGWTEQMKGHYTEAHKDVMEAHAGPDAMKKMQEWMNDAKSRWDAIEG